MIFSSLKKDLNIPVSGTVKQGSPVSDKTFDVDTVILESVGLGEANADMVEATVTNFGPPDIYGVIGPSVFKDAGRFAINFVDRKLEIGGSFKEWPGKTWIPFGKSAPLLDVTLEIAGHNIPAHIDSGRPGGLALPLKYKDVMPLTAPAEVVGTAQTVNATFDVYAAPMTETVMIGDARLNLKDVTLFETPYANIGHKALEGLYLEIDWVNERFALRGESSPEKRATSGSKSKTE